MILIKNKVVTDGERVYPNYMWCEVDGEKRIWSCNSNRPLSIVNRNGSGSVTLNEDNKHTTRSLDTLRRNSFPEEFLPANIKKFKDVFGYQDYYCFNPKNPFQIWSKKKMQFIRAASNHNRNAQHFKFNIYLADGNNVSMYVHKMVWQSYHKKKLQKGWQIHHLSHDWMDNSNKNLIALPESVHVSFEKYYGMYKNMNSYYKTQITKQQLIEKIKKYAISKTLKRKLIQSL